MKKFLALNSSNVVFIMLINVKMPTISMKFILLINVKMPTIVGILTFMSRINFVLSPVEHGKSFITSRLGQEVIKLFSYSTEHE